MKGRRGGEHLPVQRITLITLKYANPPYHISFNICNSKMDCKGSLLLIVIALQYNLTLQQQISCRLSRSLQGLFALFSAPLETWPIGSGQASSLPFPFLALVIFSHESRIYIPSRKPQPSNLIHLLRRQAKIAFTPHRSLLCEREGISASCTLVSC